MNPQRDLATPTPVARFCELRGNCFTSTAQCIGMDDLDPDTVMIAAGVVLSLIAVLELYPAWKNARKPS